MKKILFLTILFCCTLNGYAQTVEEVQEEKCTKDTIRKKRMRFTPPEFVGGLKVLQMYLRANIRYPKEAYKRKISGTVIISMMIEEDGSISEVKAIRSPHYAMSTEAIRVVESMPKWTPATRDGVPVRFNVKMPISFNITQ